MKYIFIVVFTLSFLIEGASQINNGLIACYPFKGNANDESGFAHHGTVFGATLTADRFGMSNSAYYFNGVQDYISVGLFSGFTASDKFSISVWIQPDIVKLQTILFLMPDNFYDRFNAMAYYSHNGVSSTIWDFGNCTSGGRLMQVGTPFSGMWQHWVYTISPANGMSIYKDGLLYLSQPSSSALLNRQRILWIGGGNDGAGAPFYFKGKIDDIRLYERELISSEVQDLFLLNELCSPTGLVNLDASEMEYRINVRKSSIIVEILPGAEIKAFKLLDKNGRQIYVKKNLKAGDWFEIPLEQKHYGILIYLLQSHKQAFTGKLFAGNP